MTGGVDRRLSGADPHIATVYSCLIRHGTLTADQLGGLLREQLDADGIRRALDELVTLRLAEPGTNGDGFVPLSPDAAARVLAQEWDKRLSDEEAELNRNRRTAAAQHSRVAGLRTVYHESRAQFDGGGALDVLDAWPDVRALLVEAIEYCREEIVACLPGNGPAIRLFAAGVHGQALSQRGVRVRRLYPHAALFDAAAVDDARSAIASGVLVRTTAELPTAMIVIDRAVAFLARWDCAEGGVVVREPSAAHALHACFEQAWRGAHPFRPGLRAARQNLDETKGRILQLLAEGHTDKVVASRLGIAERTCREHVSTLYKLLGARSRFQAGAAAAARGMVSVDNPA